MFAEAVGAGLPIERLANGADSWLALAMLTIAILTAAGLSVRGGAIRAVGLIAGAIALGVGSIALLDAQLGGAFARFKPGKTPLDPFKNVLLDVMLAVAASLAILLLIEAVRTLRSPSAMTPLAATNHWDRYGWISRFLHWSIAALILALIPLGLFMSGLPEGARLREPLYIVHKSLGMTVLLLTIVRIIWGQISHLPALPGDLKRARRRGAKIAHVALYVLMLGFPITGYFLSSYFGKVVPFYFADVPRLVAESKAAALPFGGLHKILLPVLFYLVFAAHVAGALMRHGDRRRALQRMTG